MSDAWTDAAPRLDPLFDGARFELRFSLAGQAAVRMLAPDGAVAPRHAESPDPPAPWSARVSCGDAVGWLLGERAPRDEAAARDVLGRAVDRHCALTLQRIAAQHRAMAADLLDTITHRLRTDISALQVIAEGALAVPFEDHERLQVRSDVAQVGVEAQRRLSAAREVMTALQPAAERAAEPLIELLRRELEGAGVRLTLASVQGEAPAAFVPGAGWSACARLLADALASDGRLAGASVAVGPDRDGWSVVAGAEAGEALPWTERALGGLAHAGAIAVAAGGSAAAGERDGRLRVQLTVPAAPSG